MSVTLKLTHEEGIRLRQQAAHKIEQKDLTGDHTVIATEWRFVKRPASDGKIVEECQQDEDPRRVGSDGRKVQLGTYTVHITAGMNNLVIERKGKVAPFNFKNGAIRNQVRVQYQRLLETGKKTKEGKPIHEWKNDGSPQYLPPNTFGGAFVGDGQRAIVDEMPT
jgi:RNase P/RNase MRP subunit p29